MIPEEEIRRLCLDIYRLTGKKVDMDDPIIIAALFFSSLMTEKRAELEAMSKKEQKDLPRLLDEAFRRNQKALEHSIPRIRQRLDQYVERLIVKIRGNVSDHDDKQGGGESTQPSGNAIHATRKLAKDIKGTVCVSGATDHIFDSTGRKASLDNGHIWMTRITGAGCSASAMIGAFAAIQPDYWQAVTAAMAYMGIAGELAAETVISQNLGVGSMQTALLDKLQLMDKNEFLTRLKISSNA